MFIPHIQQLETIPAIQEYADLHATHTGQTITVDYLYKANNRFFGIYKNKVMIGGFILGYPPAFRAIEAFASPDQYQNLYQQLEEENLYTEISCLWISSAFQHKLFIHFYLWLTIFFVLGKYGTFQFIYGTSNRQFANFFSNLFDIDKLHEDYIEEAETAIFLTNRKQLKKGLMKYAYEYFKKIVYQISFYWELPVIVVKRRLKTDLS